MAIPIIQYWWEMTSEGAKAARYALKRKGIKDKIKTLADEFIDPSRGLGMMIHLLHMACLWLAIVLPVLKWDGVLNWDWSLAFVPFFVLSGLVVVQGFVKAWGGNSVYLNKALNVNAAKKDRPGMLGNDKDDLDNQNNDMATTRRNEVEDNYNSMEMRTFSQPSSGARVAVIPKIVAHNLVRRGKNGMYSS
jgi:hypothetical protein